MKNNEIVINLRQRIAEVYLRSENCKETAQEKKDKKYVNIMEYLSDRLQHLYEKLD